MIYCQILRPEFILLLAILCKLAKSSGVDFLQTFLSREFCFAFDISPKNFLQVTFNPSLLIETLPHWFDPPDNENIGVSFKSERGRSTAANKTIHCQRIERLFTASELALVFWFRLTA